MQDTRLIKHQSPVCNKVAAADMHLLVTFESIRSVNHSDYLFYADTHDSLNAAIN